MKEVVIALTYRQPNTDANNQSKSRITLNKQTTLLLWYHHLLQLEEVHFIWQ